MGKFLQVNELILNLAFLSVVNSEEAMNFYFMRLLSSWSQSGERRTLLSFPNIYLKSFKMQVKRAISN